ncbi:hypothetical protein BVG19_g4717 [[Candida] boidinii]|nr:hypothetical protein BVG19_g4717 [[Candida] boidinii]OWB52216.1 hypothetical protein B5S27_g3788 [[Candida] boidinii]OWB86912.1 hypothetical protein B5S33_g5636 [[Candida] boidinii]
MFDSIQLILIKLDDLLNMTNNDINLNKLIYINYFKDLNFLAFLKDILFFYLISKILIKSYYQLKGYGLINNLVFFKNAIVKFTFNNIIFLLPSIHKKIQSQLTQVKSSIEKSLIKHDPTVLTHNKLPSNGFSQSNIIKFLKDFNNLKYSNWENGRLSGAVYHGGQDLINLQSEAWKLYAVSNQLHPDCFPALRQMDAEVVSMCLNIFNAPIETENACGTSTSGGTESLILACLSAREYYKKFKSHGFLATPDSCQDLEVIAPKTIHAAVSKACYYFNLKLKLADLDPVTYKVDINHVKRLITPKTCLILGSAPNFPHGIMDDIEKLSEIGLQNNIPVHVDCCLGSFIVAFMQKSGFAKNLSDTSIKYDESADDHLPCFDFRLKGVTSISCDTHKYGFAPKGSSVILYRNQILRECQYYISSDWIGGLYGSPTLAGSRPGALIVACWATLMNIGEDGYIKSCQDIIGASRKLKRAIKEDIPELQIIGDPKLCVVSFTSDLINVHELGDLLTEKGWHLSCLQKPTALHLAATTLSVPIIDELIQDIKDTVAKLLPSSTGNDKRKESETATLYGVAGSIHTGKIADKVVATFLDTLYESA